MPQSIFCIAKSVLLFPEVAVLMIDVVLLGFVAVDHNEVTTQDTSASLAVPNPTKSNTLPRSSIKRTLLLSCQIHHAVYVPQKDVDKFGIT